MSQAIPPPQPDRRPFFSGQAKELDEDAQKRSAAAAQQLGSAIGDPASIGAKLMGKMGFGVAGQGLGRTGQVGFLTCDWNMYDAHWVKTHQQIGFES